MSADANTPLPADITIGDKYGPAMEIKTQEEADVYFEKCVVHSMRHGRLRPEAEQLERGNLGYYAGYYGEETRERVERLFKCAHPIFGKIAEHGPPAAEEAFDRGVRGGLGLGL
jgi:hypothetical protein